MISMPQGVGRVPGVESCDSPAFVAFGFYLSKGFRAQDHSLLADFLVSILGSRIAVWFSSPLGNAI